MSISSVGSSGFDQSALSGLYKQSKQDFKTLVSDVKSGDLAGAQTALSAWQLDKQNLDSAKSASGSSATQIASTTTANPVQIDLAALIQAIKSGDITGAQSDLAALQNDVKTQATSGGGHHHHHVHGGGDAGAQTGVGGSGQTASGAKTNDGDADDNASATVAGTANNANASAISSYAAIANLQSTSSLLSASA